VASLIEARLIDELNLFVNPATLGKGLPIFMNRNALELISATPFECGIALLVYKPKQ
jgi:dihydrofolate reductase